jgi:hypothetical protein
MSHFSFLLPIVKSSPYIWSILQKIMIKFGFKSLVAFIREEASAYYGVIGNFEGCIALKRTLLIDREYDAFAIAKFAEKTIVKYYANCMKPSKFKPIIHFQDVMRKTK